MRLVWVSNGDSVTLGELLIPVVMATFAELLVAPVGIATPGVEPAMPATDDVVRANEGKMSVDVLPQAMATSW